ncbi:DUF6090 family protein [Formosa sp. S-31]|uniref:DUF6090 family protein n=1 Tax=Formosa sp. S-31 TaxID=2790949 RepID=UPI003EB7AE10
MKIFRQFRNKFIMENTKKYILYALGEIFLIVLGILIALQIGKWNENKIRTAKEHSYLSALKTDLNTQIKELDILYDNDILQCQNIETVMKKFSVLGEDHQLDSIYPLINELTNRYTFKSVNSTFTELNSTGNLDLIHDSNLRSDILKYYQYTSRIEKIVNSNNSNFVDDIYNKNLLPITLYSLDMMSSNFLDVVGITSIPNAFLPDEPLKQTSRTLISKEENKLLLFNLITRRYMVAKIQTLFYAELKTKTHDLLAQVNQYIH